MTEIEYIKLTGYDKSAIYVKADSIIRMRYINDLDHPYTRIHTVDGHVFSAMETPETILESLGYQKQEEK